MYLKDAGQARKVPYKNQEPGTPIPRFSIKKGGEEISFFAMYMIRALSCRFPYDMATFDLRNPYAHNFINVSTTFSAACQGSIIIEK
jgi:hypothetical protein